MVKAGDLRSKRVEEMRREKAEYLRTVDSDDIRDKRTKELEDVNGIPDS